VARESELQPAGLVAAHRLSGRFPAMRAAALAVLALLVLPVPALAAPPPNDLRSAPQDLGALPALVRGTTVDATTDVDEPPTGCGAIKNSVWYAFTATSRRELLVALDAAGDMDAVVDLFVRERSQATSLDCARTNRSGLATIDTETRAGTSYLIRVAPLFNSTADRFTLRVLLPQPPATPPGTPLPRRGVTGQVDRLANPDNAYAVRLRKGVTYRMNLVSAGTSCVRAELFAPGSYGSSAGASAVCDGEEVYTPPASGVYTIRVAAPRASRAVRTYFLRVGRAGADDSAPGLPLADDHRVHGALHGEALDTIDLYRFTLPRRSDVRIRLATARDFDVQLLRSTGGRIACACGEPGAKDLTRRLRAGRYFIAVRARNGDHGGYVLSRLASVITRSRMLVDGKRSESVPPGRSVALQLRVSPAVTGRATLVVERFDPLAGWLFFARYHPRVSGEAATVAFRPPFVGRFRVTGDYDGTRKSSASPGGTASFRVLEPLTAG
jgi:hypothetical protein